MITCDEPEVPPGTYVIGYDFNVHSKIEYHCEAGHKMIGEYKQVCQRNGEWSGSTPICECKNHYVQQVYYSSFTILCRHKFYWIKLE